MSFLAPGYLAALAVASIPLLIHLINRRRARRHRFAAIEFVLRSHRSATRRFKLKQFLLLLVRTLAIAAIPLILARPYQAIWEADSFQSSGKPTSTVIVLDDSMSMGWLEDDETLLEKAKNQARDIVRGLRSEDNIALVLAGSPPRAVIPELSFDQAGVQDAIDAIRPTHRATDLAGAISSAASILGSSVLERQRVVLISDLQAAGFERSRLDWTESHGPELVMVDVAKGSTRANHAILSVQIFPAPDAGRDTYRVDARVANLSASPQAELAVSVSIDDRTVAKGFVSLASNEEKTKSFLIPLGREGIRRGEVRLSADQLAADDVRPFSIRVQRNLRVLVVNGDPHAVSRQDEVFYLERALLPGTDTGSRLSPRVIEVELLAEQKLEEFDVIILANVGSVPPQVPRRIDAWVRSGGGLLVTSGDQMGESPSSWLTPFLPGPVRGNRALGANTINRQVHLGAIPAGLPLFEVFLGEGGEGLRSSVFRRYLLVEPRAGQNHRVLISYDDGAPALMDRSLGQGRIALFTSSIDLDWTDLALSTGFLPLLQELCHFLARSTTRNASKTYPVATPIAVQIPDQAATASLMTPDGKTHNFLGDALSGRKELVYSKTSQPGIYTLRFEDSQGAPLDEQDVVIAPVGHESALRPLGARAVASLSNSGGRSAEQGNREAPNPEQRQDLWPWAILLLVAMLASEALLLTRRRRRQPAVVIQHSRRPTI